MGGCQIIDMDHLTSLVSTDRTEHDRLDILGCYVIQHILVCIFLQIDNSRNIQLFKKLFVCLPLFRNRDKYHPVSVSRHGLQQLSQHLAEIRQLQVRNQNSYDTGVFLLIHRCICKLPDSLLNPLCRLCCHNVLPVKIS